MGRSLSAIRLNIFWNSSKLKNDVSRVLVSPTFISDILNLFLVVFFKRPPLLSAFSFFAFFWKPTVGGIAFELFNFKDARKKTRRALWENRWHDCHSVTSVKIMGKTIPSTRNTNYQEEVSYFYGALMPPSRWRTKSISLRYRMHLTRQAWSWNDSSIYIDVFKDL